MKKVLFVLSVLLCCLVSSVSANVPELGTFIEPNNGSYYQTYTFDDYIVRSNKDGKIMEIDLTTPNYSYAGNKIGDIYHPVANPIADYTYNNTRYVTTEENPHGNIIRVEINEQGIVSGIVLLDKSLNLI